MLSAKLVFLTLLGATLFCINVADASVGRKFDAAECRKASREKAPHGRIQESPDFYDEVRVDRFSVAYEGSLFTRSDKSIALEDHIDASDELGACFKGKPIVEDVPESFCAPLKCLVSPITKDPIDMDQNPFMPLPPTSSGTEPQCLEPRGGQARASREKAQQQQQQPEVSFIMPVHNSALKAAQSIFELFRTAREVPSAEFIVVDDGSTEDFAPVHFVLFSLKKLFDVDVTLLRSKANHGFSASVRAGFLRAKGKWVSIINSDTFVAKGWLRMLHVTAESNPLVGIVGPLFLGDGMVVQEAGGLLFRDGSAANGGRGAQTGPIPAMLNHLRVVDYISAACIMIKRSVLSEAGGFLPQSNLYHQGYYEDPDLAMEMRKMGKDVVYQPMSVVFHQEGGTFGTDEDSELKRSLMKTNKKVFYNKWKDDLQRHCDPSSDKVHSLYRLAGGQSVLFVDSVIPSRDHDAGSVRTLNIARLMLGKGYRVTFRTLHGNSPKAYAELRRLGVSVFPPEPLQQWTLSDSKNACLYDVIVVSHRDVFQTVIGTLKSQCPNVPVIFDTVDIHFLREARLFLSGSSKLLRETKWDFSRTSVPSVTKWIDTSQESKAELVRKNKDIEMNLVKQANATWVVSPAELDILRQYGATEEDNVSLVSLVHEIPSFTETPRCKDRSGLLFVGNFLHEPNHQAVVTLLRDVLPLVAKRMSPRSLIEFKVHVAGAEGLPPDIIAWVRRQEQNSSFVEFHGHVSDDNLRKLNDNVRIVVAPLVSGAGVKGKVVDAMKRGIPVVTTPVAAEGMRVVDGRDCMVASTPLEFALKIIELYDGCDDVWPRMARSGYESAAKHFSLKTVAPRVTETLKVLGVGPEQNSQNSGPCG